MFVAEFTSCYSTYLKFALLFCRVMAVPATVIYFTCYDQLHSLLRVRMGDYADKAPLLAGALARGEQNNQNVCTVTNAFRVCVFIFLLCAFQRGRRRSSVLWSWSELSCRPRNSRTGKWRTASARPCRPKAGVLCGGALGRRSCETCPSQPCTGTTTRREKPGCVSGITQESPHLALPSYQEQFPALWVHLLSRETKAGNPAWVPNA